MVKELNAVGNDLYAKIEAATKVVSDALDDHYISMVEAWNIFTTIRATANELVADVYGSDEDFAQLIAAADQAYDVYVVSCNFKYIPDAFGIETMLKSALRVILHQLLESARAQLVNA